MMEAPFAKAYWVGRHATYTVGGRPFLAPLGKLHSEGLEVLHSHGWRRVPPDIADLVPVFALTTRKGMCEG